MNTITLQPSIIKAKDLQKRELWTIFRTVNKCFTVIILIFLFTQNSFPQIGINSLNQAPDPAAMLDIKSNSKGLLIPRMTTAEKNSIPNKPDGLTVFDINLKVFSYWKTNSLTGSWVDFPQNNQNTPVGTIVLSEIYPNSNLETSSFSYVSKTQLNEITFVPGAFGWGIPPSNINAPSYRGEHTAVWTGSDLVVFGGYNDQSNTFLSDIKRYNVASDTWSSMSVSPLAERSQHAAIYTGSEMIIWGGVNETNHLADGARYNFITNSWQLMSSINAPFKRYSFASVWTGTEMIVWGGSYGPLLNDGKKYNPITNTWANMTTINAPAARFEFSSVWTGSKMIIYGGNLGSNNTTNTGGIYDPNTDTWIATSTIGAPPNGLRKHTAIWTGTEMILVGGKNNNNQAENNVYIYNPTTNTWRIASTINKPNGNLGHSATWTGNKMILTGGLDAVLGIYNAGTDTWETNTTIPYNFNYSTATWTGSKLILIGTDIPQALVMGTELNTLKTYYLYKKM